MSRGQTSASCAVDSHQSPEKVTGNVRQGTRKRSHLPGSALPGDPGWGGGLRERGGLVLETHIFTCRAGSCKAPQVEKSGGSREVAKAPDHTARTGPSAVT